jgi:hypothetical protein
MKELKKMIVDNLLDEYPLEEAIRDVEEAEIVIKGSAIHVIWSNGVTNDYKIETIERLVLVS